MKQEHFLLYSFYGYRNQDVKMLVTYAELDS